MKVLNKEEYENLVLKTEGVAFVDFYADWCGPCRMLTPILEQVETEVKVPMFKLNIDNCDDIARSLGIMSIPTMIVFKQGKEQERIIGLKSKEDIINLLKKY